ncbi:MAG TPA: D-aminoacylase [Vicinamibacterales bacterium]|nr:D-aminoacylase [Vicinamibacterales bacterium]
MRTIVIAWLATVLLTLAVGAQAPPYDLVIVNARLVDGTGAPARLAAVAVAGGRIAAIGKAADRPSRERIDGTGLVVAPGFIDVHTHADDIEDKPLASNFVRMGVTTIVAGNCGTSALPVGDALERIRVAGVAVNVATLVGHNTVRATVMGRERRDPTLTEMRRMRELVFRAMAEGALGFSTGLQYVPGTYARSSEVIELARVAANEGGIYATHLRNEGTHLEAALSEAIGVARLLRMPLEISHLKVDSPARWGASTVALEMLAEARRRGLVVQADQYAYTAGSSSLAIRFPAWALEGGADATRARLSSNIEWRRIRTEMVATLAERGFSDLAWASVAHHAADPSLNGLSMAVVAERLVGDGSAESQFEAARRLQMAGGASMVYHVMHEDDVVRIMRDPFVSIASDAGVIEPGRGVPHPRGSGNTARVLGTYVRERGVLTLEEAVRRMTSLPARHFRLAGRGEVRVGAPADLVVFDPARVADRATYSQPHASPAGMALVVVNGVVVVREGQHTGARQGSVVRRQR